MAAVLQRRASEVWVLHPDWLIYCRWSLSRCQESTFMLNQLPPGQPLPSPAMDYSPISAPVAFSAAAPSGGGSNGNLSAASRAVAIADAPGIGGDTNQNQKKRGREAEMPSASPKKPEPEDSMLTALKRLKAVGPAVSVGSLAPTHSGAALSRPPAGLVGSILTQNGAGGEGRPGRAPSPTDQQRKSFLFQQAPSGATSTGGIDRPVAPADRNGQQSAAGQGRTAGPIGVIRKKTGALLLERGDSAGEKPVSSSGSREPGTGLSRKEDARLQDGSGAPLRRYLPGKVRLAGPEDIDRSFRLDTDADGDGYFAEPAPAQNGVVRGRTASRRRKAASDLEDGEVGDGSDADSSDGHSSSAGSGSGGSNSLLGDGDGDFQLYDEDEAGVGGGGGEDDDGADADSAGDEGMLCCNDDQGSTCSATPIEGEETWGQRKVRRRRESRRDRAAQGEDDDAAGGACFEDVPGDSSDGSSVDFARAAAAGGLANGLPKLLPASLAMQRLHSSTNSLRSAAGHSSNAASSDDDDCSDFEVMMMRRRRLNAGVPGAPQLLSNLGVALENPIVIDDEDAYSDSV